ncbi:hypothetical protein G4228_016997 [Cervus hanglu yarkandensis]|nr:hypothetical protein G4228_016997 [Cervus hanglu yarkandensis]
MDSLIAANTKFCFDLFQKISTDDCRKNIFFCPLSLSAALGMVRLGARSGSARQIDQVLHFNELSQNKGNEPDPCLKKAEQEVPADSNLEGQKEVAGPLTLQEYLDGVIQFYHTTVESVDFQKDTEKSRQEINFWVESQSQGKIKELFSKDSINNETVLVLVNAVYFKAKWEKYFDCENTVDAVFSLSESEKQNVKMMNQNGLFRIGFVDELKVQILELPYTKGKLDMVVLLPSGSADNLKALEELERNITYEKLMAWSSSENMSEKRVAVSFPRFTLEDSYDLNPILQDMGITDIFDETKADLTGISPSPSLYLSKVVHKTFVEVDENGTQAVAAKKIKDLLPDGSLSSSIKLVVVNVIYFKGQWNREFKKENTKEEEFWLNKSTSKSVLMMTQRQSFSFKTLEDVPAKILGLLYRNHDLSMFVLLPNDIDGLEKIIDKITPEKLIEWTSAGRMEERAVDLHLPRFRAAGSYDLEAASAGLRAAGLAGSPGGAGLRAHRLLHRAVLEVTEAGTEAAAATAVGFAVTAAPDWERFHCNHPFLFFIRHNESDSVLFFGRFSSP